MSLLPEEDLNKLKKKERTEYAHISEYMPIYMLQNYHAYCQLPEEDLNTLKKGTHNRICPYNRI